MSGRVLVDAGPIVALLSSRDAYHAQCVEKAKSLPSPLYTCWPAMTESAYLLETKQGRAISVLEYLESGNLRLLSLDETDAPAIGYILQRFRDQSFSLPTRASCILPNARGSKRSSPSTRRTFPFSERGRGVR